MPQGKQIIKPGEAPLKVFDFSGGTWTKTPKEFIPNNATPYARNILYDEKNRLTKIWGTEVLISESTSNNSFIKNPVYKLYNYITLDGAQILIIQGVDATDSDMCLYSLRKGAASVSEIFAGLSLKRKCDFATYKGRLYEWNGTDPLMYWNGSSTNPDEGWHYYHENEPERFRYITPYSYRLWAARSGKNPSRVIWTEIGGCSFSADDGSGYFPTDSELSPIHFMDFATSDGAPIMHICEFMGSLLVFKANHIYRIYGDPIDINTINVVCVSDGIGTIDGGSVQVFKNIVYFAWKDGLYVYGDTQIAASAEDRKLQTVPNVVRVSSEIDDYWTTHFTLPDPSETKEHTWSGATDFADFTLSNCQINTAPAMIQKYQASFPDVINFELMGLEDIEESQTAQNAWVDLTFQEAKENYYGQTLKLDLNEDDFPICSKVPIYVKKTGTMTSSHKLNMFITATKVEGDISVPDFNKIYAMGQLIGTSVTSTTGEWVDITMSYWKHPQNCYDGEDTPGSEPTIAIAIKIEGMTSSNYISWGYDDGNPYSDGRMINADLSTPSGQEGFDYCFKWYGDTFKGRPALPEATIETDSLYADSDIDRWGHVYVALSDSTFNDYVRRSKMEKLEYNLSDNGSSWDGWVEIENGGYIAGSKRYIKFKGTFTRVGNNFYQMDSFTFISIKVTYVTQAITEQLISSKVWEHRYILSCEIDDSEGQGITGNCLDFDGGDNVWITNSATTDVGQNDFANEFWVKGLKADQAGTWVPIMGTYRGLYSSFQHHGWLLSINASTGKLHYWITDSASPYDLQSQMAACPDLLDGDPHHVAVNWDRDDEITAWVDGVEVSGTHSIASISTVPDITTDTPVLLGATSSGTGLVAPNAWYDGKLKQCRFYKGRLLSTTEIAYNYANPTHVYNNGSLVGWWKCDEGQGDTVADSSGNDNDGTRGNSVVADKPTWAEW